MGMKLIKTFKTNEVACKTRCTLLLFLFDTVLFAALFIILLISLITHQTGIIALFWLGDSLLIIAIYKQLNPDWITVACQNSPSPHAKRRLPRLPIGEEKAEKLPGQN